VIRRVFFAALAAVLVAGPAYTQSNPGWVFGYTPTPEEWEAAFSNKTDLNIIAAGSSTPRSAASRAADVVNVKDFGAYGDDIHDDTAAINNAAAYFRTLIASTVPPNTGPAVAAEFVFPRGEYKTTGSLNFTDLYSTSATITGYGAIIDAHVSGQAIFDAYGSRSLRIRGLTLIGDSTSIPTTGFQFGRHTASGLGSACDDLSVQDVGAYGSYSITPLYVFACETGNFAKFTGWQQDTASGTYAAIFDGLNHFGVTSQFVTQNLSADSLYSFNEFNVLSGDFRSARTKGLWVSNANRLNFDNSTYVATGVGTGGGGIGMVLWTPTGGGPAATELYAGIHFETNNDATFQFSGPGGVTFGYVNGFKYADNNNNVKTGGPVFAIDSGSSITSAALRRAEIRIANYDNISQTFDVPANWSGTGTYIGPYTNDRWNLATASWTGQTCINNACIYRGDASPASVTATNGVVNSLSTWMSYSTIQPSASLRNPLPSDDTTAGYVVGNQWFGTGPVLWSAKRVTAGNANWQPLPFVTRAGDSVAGPLVVYGTKLLVSAYSGNAVQLTRASDSTTKNVGFIAGMLDTGTGDAFCAGTTCQMTTLYDQSGNGYNCTASTANAPVWSTTNVIAGTRTIVFNSNPHALVNLPATLSYCTISASMSWVPSTATFFIAGIHPAGLESRTLVSTIDNSRGWLNGYNQSGLATIGYGSNCMTYIENEPSVLSISASSSTFNCYSGNYSSSQGYASQSTFTGGVIGGSSSSFPGTMDMTGFLLWGSTLNAAQVATVQASLYSMFSIPPQFNDKWVVLGDSMSSGEASLLNNTWARLTLPQLSRPIRLYNHSLFGQMITGNGGMLALFPQTVTGVYQTTDRNFIVTLLGGANDIRARVPLATIKSAVQTLVQSVHALGSNAKVLLATNPLQCDIFNTGGATLSDFQSYMTWLRTQWNVAIAAGGAGADGLIDFQNDPTIGISAGYSSSAFCSNATISPDGQHPTDYAMGFYAPTAAQVINAIIH
jgi:hypothetical protein